MKKYRWLVHYPSGSEEVSSFKKAIARLNESDARCQASETHRRFLSPNNNLLSYKDGTWRIERVNATAVSYDCNTKGAP